MKSYWKKLSLGNPKFLSSKKNRSGRFDVKIKCDLPNVDDRSGILRLKLEGKPHEVSSETITKISEESIGFTGADIDAMVNEATYMISTENSKISDTNMVNAFEIIRQGRFEVNF